MYHLYKVYSTIYAIGGGLSQVVSSSCGVVILRSRLGVQNYCIKLRFCISIILDTLVGAMPPKG